MLNLQYISYIVVRKNTLRVQLPQDNYSKKFEIRAKSKKSDDCGKDVDNKAITMPELERLG